MRTLRIGYRPSLSAPVVLSAGPDISLQLSLNALPVALDTVRVSSASVCRQIGDSSSAAYLTWEQARTAIAAAQLTGARRTLFATVLTYERTLNVSGTTIQKDVRSQSGYIKQPWLAAKPEALHDTGYVVSESNGETVYHAPDFEALLSPISRTTASG